MSQEFQPRTMETGQREQMSQQPSQQMGQSSQGMGQQMGQQSQGRQSTGQTQTGGMQSSQGTTRQQLGRLSQQERSAMTSVAQAIEVCSWCADQCIQEANPNMIECIRLCEDVAELGEATMALASRNSRYAQTVVQAFQQAVQDCAQECGRHQAGHCQECAQTLSQTASAVQSLGQQGGGQQMQTQSW